MVAEAATALLGLACVLVLLCAARLFFILRGISSERKRYAVATPSFNTTGGSSLFSRPGRRLKSMIVLGSGGHTKEIIQLTGVLSPDIYYPRIYVVASSDALSVDKVKALEGGRCGTDCDGSSGSGRLLPAPSGPESSYTIVTVPRSREVRQSWPSTCLSSVRALVVSFALVVRHRPDVVLCNGPGTCVPLCAAAFVCRLLLVLPHVRIVFVESICRVRSLSLSGMILYRFADYFLVQWPSLCDAYPLASYIGRLL